MTMVAPPVWTGPQLEAERQKAMAVFRRQRMEEPLEAYLQEFDRYQGVIEDLLESTVDLTAMSEQAIAILTDERLLEAFRYLSGPPISLDDLKVVAEAERLSERGLQADPDAAKRLIDSVLLGLDRRRFPWVADAREPTEPERAAAVLASAAIMATRRVETNRRTEGKTEQEQRVRNALLGIGFTEVPPRAIPALHHAPTAGQFCMESLLGTRKADIVVGLGDRRTLPVECKVSNSATNSVKRLNNDAAVKATTWRHDFGSLQVVPSAVLGGVYKLRNLEDAQARGLTLFWAHDLVSFTAWILQAV